MNHTTLDLLGSGSLRVVAGLASFLPSKPTAPPCNERLRMLTWKSPPHAVEPPRPAE